MTREEFREAVFARDGHACVVCGEKNVPLDAHHLMERRLWSDGGYHLDNGVSLCHRDHLNAESGAWTPDYLREKAGITKVLLPEHLPPDAVYDKWGNVQISEDEWSPGELFYDESVQKVLGPRLHQFRRWVKYPRTPHLPWSPGATDDDLVSANLDFVADGPVVITEKMDGENTTLYRDYIHARSLDSNKYHESRTWVKNFHAKFAHEIPHTFRIVGENLYAQHAIAYRDLPSYFMVFSIWDGDSCLSWETTLEWCELLELTTVPALWRGYAIDAAYLEGAVYPDPLYSDEREGYVVRNANGFKLRDFRYNIAKYVRPNHINADTQNWFAKPVVPNRLTV